MKRYLICALITLFAAATLSGCRSEAEIPTLPNDSKEQSAPQGADYALSDADKLEDMAVGETAVWNDYELSVDSKSVEGGMLVVSITVKAHASSVSLSADNMLLEGWECESDSFGGTIQVSAGKSTSGTLSFENTSGIRIFWNDGSTEATWYLNKEAEIAQKPEEPAKTSSSETIDNLPLRSTAESKLESLLDNYTYYSFVSVDPSMTFEKQDDGTYLLSGPVNILDGNGSPASVPLSTWWSEAGECVSMELEGVKMF